MPVIEYKFVINQHGKMEIPGYVEDRGHWYNPDDHTYLGWVKAEADREYWVPDTIQEKDRNAVIARGIDMHTANTMSYDSDGVDVNYDSAGVTTLMGNWYDNFVNVNSG